MTPNGTLACIGASCVGKTKGRDERLSKLGLRPGVKIGTLTADLHRNLDFFGKVCPAGKSLHLLAFRPDVLRFHDRFVGTVPSPSLSR